MTTTATAVDTTNRSRPVICGEVMSVDTATGSEVRCSRNFGHLPGHDNGGTLELQRWMDNQTAVELARATQSPLDSVDHIKHMISLQIRSYEATAHWKRERGLSQDAGDNEERASALKLLLAQIEGRR